MNKITERGVKIMDRNSEIFIATKTLNNMKNHDYSVQAYRIEKDEAEVIQRALVQYLSGLNFDYKLSVADIFDRMDNYVKEFDNSTRELQFFDLKN